MKNLTVLLVFLNLPSLLISQTRSDSLWSIWSDETQSVTKRLEAISVIHEDKDNLPILSANPDTVFYHAQLQYDLAEANGLKYWMGDALMTKGSVFLRKNEHKKAREYYVESLALAKEIKDKKQIASNSFNLGTIPFKEGDFALAFPYYQRAAKLFEELGEKEFEALTLSNIALLFAQQKEIKQSNEYLRKAISIREEIAKTNNGFRNKLFLAAMKQNYKSQEAKLVIMDNSTDSLGKTEAVEKIRLAKDSMLLLATQNDKRYQKASKKASNNKAYQKQQVTKEKSFFRTVGGLTAEAQIYLDQKDTVKAIPYLEEALSPSSKRGGNKQYWLGVIYFIPIL